MTVQLQGIVSTYENASGTLVNLTYPSGVVSGELIVAVITHSYATAPTTNPGGWTLAASQDQTSSGGPSVAVWYRVSAGTESGDVQFQTDSTAYKVAGHMFRLSGVNATVEDVTEGKAATTDITLVTPSVTTTTSNVLLLHAIALRSTTTDITAPGGPTRIAATSGTGRRLNVYTEPKASAGATGTRTWTADSTLQWAGITLAIRASTSGPGTVLAVKATATALARVPLVGAVVAHVKATATAQANVPVVSNGALTVNIAHVKATGTAAAIVPVVWNGSTPAAVTAVKATASSLARVPIVSNPGWVTGVKATATAMGRAPKVYFQRVFATECVTGHTAYIYDRGGEHQIGLLGPVTRIRWERRRDDVSSATVYLATPSDECVAMMGQVHAGRHEMVIFRGMHRVWEGPVVRIGFKGSAIEIEAHDVAHYSVRTTMHNEYDDSYPNNGKVLDRIDRILTAELARKEALNPPINVLAHVQFIYATPPVTDAGTAAHTLPYQYTVFQHFDEFAARGGIDYTVVGRAMLFFDVNTPLGQTAAITMDDFIGQPIITEYGMELGTNVSMTDGKGNHGDAGAVDPYYGEWEMLFQAYDENTATPGSAIPTVAELTSQAQRSWNQSKLPPTVVRIPDNTRLNPNGALSVESLVPGVHIPFTAELPGRSMSQMQKLDSMSVEETADGGEVIKVTLSPAVLEGP
jgi:hypothetical protein